MSALAPALYTAALALAGKIVFDVWSRYRDRKGLAAALAGEIGAYMRLLRPAYTAANIRAIVHLDRELRVLRLKATPALPTTHPVFDKVADKIGNLSNIEAIGVCRAYNVVTGMRLLMTGMSSEAFVNVDEESQLTRLRFIADCLESEGQKAIVLVGRLKKTASTSLLTYIAFDPIRVLLVQERRRRRLRAAARAKMSV